MKIIISYSEKLQETTLPYDKHCPLCDAMIMAGQVLYEVIDHPVAGIYIRTGYACLDCVDN